MSPSSTEAQYGSDKLAVSESAATITGGQNNTSVKREQTGSGPSTSATASSNKQLRLPSASTSMLARWTHETRESELTWTEKTEKKQQK